MKNIVVDVVVKIVSYNLIQPTARGSNVHNIPPGTNNGVPFFSGKMFGYHRIESVSSKQQLLLWEFTQ